MYSSILRQYFNPKETMKLIFVLTVIALFSFCFSSCNEKPMPQVVYEDEQGIIHVDYNCKHIQCGGDSYPKSYSVDSIGSLLSDKTKHLCTYCINSNEKSHFGELAYEYEKQERNRKYHIKEYESLCKIGLDRWFYVDNYLKYISNEENRKHLNEELEKQGYDLDDLVAAMTYDNDYFIDKRNNYEIELREDFVAWVYFQLLVSGIKLGTLDAFKASLLEDDYMMDCCSRAIEIGIVKDYKQFFSMMFEPDSEYCKEVYWDDWKDEMKYEIREEEEYMDELRYGTTDNYDIEHYEPR